MNRGFRWGGARRALWAAAASGLVVLGLGVACSKTDSITGPSGALHTIIISPSPDTVAVGASKTLTATGQDASGHTIPGLTFFWSSSEDSVAAVTQGGLITGMTVGQSQIAASAEGVSGFATVVVTPKPVGSIIVVPATVTLRIATTLQLTDTVKDATGNVLTGETVTWSSDSAPIVSVDGNGLVTARALGVAHIKAAAGGKSAVATITVSQVPVRSITITPAAPGVFVSQTTQLTAVTKDSAGDVLPGRVVRWNSENPSIATIDSVAGLLTGVSAGGTVIHAVSEGVTDSVTATISNAPASTVILSPNVSQVDVGATLTLTATVTNTTGGTVTNPTVTFMSNKPTVASVTSSSGATAQILAGPSAGTATITGTSGAATGTATIIVSLVGVDSVHIGAAHDTLTTGQSETMTATAFDSSGNVLSGRTVTWQSSNTGVATVNSVTGAVSAVAPGIVVIFATVSGVKGSLALLVVPVPVGSVVITPHADTIQVLQQLQLTATVRDINGNLINPPQGWYTPSPSTSIAVVTASGLVTGVGPGTAMIIDSTGGKADTNTTLVIAPVATVTMNPPSATITLAQTLAVIPTLLDAHGNPLTGRPITWTSSNHAVDTVSQSGVVYPVRVGIDTIRATVTQPPAAPAVGITVITVTDPVASVTLSPTPATITLAQTQTLAATLKDVLGATVTGRSIIWSSSNHAVDTVSQGGIVYPVGVGTDTIFATVTQPPAAPVTGMAKIIVTPVPVATVTLSPTPATITFAQTQLLTPTLKAASGAVLTGRTLAWTSSNHAIDTVSASGVVYPVGVGTDTITATVTQSGPAVSGSAILTVTDPVASVTLTPTPASITLAQTEPLTVVLKDVVGNTVTGRPITWVSSKHAVDTVSASGVVYPVGVGVDTITATVTQPPAAPVSGIAVITVSDPVTSVALAPPSATITLAQTQPLTTTLKDVLGNTVTGRTITWASSNHAVDTVSASGVVYPVGVGIDTITATVNQAPATPVSGTAVITVTDPVTSVTLSPTPATITLAQTQVLTPTLKDVLGNAVTGRPITWASSNHAVDTVSASGIVYPVGVGTDTITATVSQPSGAVSGTATITVTLVPVASVTLTPTPATITLAQTEPLTASLKDANGNPLTGRTLVWASSNHAVDTVSQAGIVYPVGVGTDTITATVTQPGPAVTGAAIVTVTDPVASVTLTPTPATITLAQTQPLTATLKDVVGNTVTGRPITWASSNHAVDTVSASGIVYPVGVGTDTITATVSQPSGAVSGAATITVTLVPVASVTLTPTPATITLTQTEPLTATLKDVNGNTLTGRTLVWASSNHAVDTVSQSGIVYPVGVGTDTITATVTQPGPAISGTAIITVTDPVASVTLTPTAATITLARTQPLTPTLKDASGTVLTGRTITWTSSNHAIDTVSASGVVYPVGVGTDTITATVTQPPAAPVSGTAVITVTDPVASVTLTPTPAAITLAQTQPLTAALKDVLGNPVTGRTITWVSSNAAVDSVSQSGIVYPLGAGIDTITATVTQPPAAPVSGTAVITVTDPVASVTLAPPSATITLAQTQVVIATLKDVLGNTVTGRPVTWVSSNHAVDTVSASGVVYPVGAGTDTITATVIQPPAAPVSGTTVIAVTDPVASVALSPTPATITLTQTQPLTAALKDVLGNTVTGRALTWASSNHAVDTVSASGIVYPVGVGIDTITATVTQSGPAVSGIAVITVTDPVASVTLSPTPATLTLAQTQPLSATLKDAGGTVLTGRALVWTTSNPAVDTVSQSGIVYPVGPGTDTITATVTQSGPAVSGAAVITVTDPVASVTLSPTPATITLAQTQALTPVLKDVLGNTVTGRPLTWVSSNHAVDTVSASGVVYPVGVGTDTITATVTQSGPAVSGAAVITVTDPVATVTLSPTPASINLTQTQPLTATLKDAGGNTVTGRAIAWTSSNPAIDTVSQSGIVYPVGAGTDTITATVTQPPAGTVSGMAVITVTDPVATVIVYPTPDTIFATAASNTVQLSDSTKDAGGNNLTGRTVTWSVTGGTVATVNANNGLVSANNTAAGTATITATSTDGPAGNATVLVLGHSQSVTVTILPDSTLSVSSTGFPAAATGTVTVLDTFGNPVESTRPVVWQTSDPTTVTINGSPQPSVQTTAGASVTLAAVSTNSAVVTITVTAVDNAGATSAAPISVVP